MSSFNAVGHAVGQCQQIGPTERGESTITEIREGDNWNQSERVIEQRSRQHSTCSEVSC